MNIVNNLAIYESGKGNQQSIIFVHGFPYDHTMWDNQVDFLKDEFHCVTYDIRGLGKSEAGDGQFTMEMFVDDLFDIIDKLELKHPLLCGLSMGGYISLRAVERDQFKFSGLILCDTKSEADNTEAKLKRASGIKTINNEGLEKFIEATVPATFAKETIEKNKDIFDRTFERAKKENPVGVKGSLLAMLSRTDTTPYLENIKIPTLVISGTVDALTPPEVMRKMAEKISNSEFAVAPRAGHMAPLENPGFVNDMIKGFLKKV